ncbi:protein phosphatase PHLPP-like protein [Drosophila albomicans]|uniref:Protein phosphatase PHLPP-like protein n=1 Tax=Drosophila albomicans TaxID=7291 RepID=A0A6P8WA54_DROAB|nr:protein phosphatase PHLPP-like protein [Drosophila albomicans]
MLKAVKKSTEVNKAKLKLSASNGNENNITTNNNNNKNKNSSSSGINSNKDSDNNSEVSSALDLKRETIVGQISEGSSNDCLPLKKLSLKGNQLCGSILIGNYNYLTQLEVCENEMEVLDLSSLAQLETLKCSYNKLIELIFNGSNLQTLIADHNCLQSVPISKSVPLKLLHIDLSHNYLSELPKWIGECVSLVTLSASHNLLNNVTELLSNCRIKCLQTLDLAYNRLQELNYLPDSFCSVRQLQLQSNELQCLPANFFAVTHSHLSSLNASCNRLTSLPRYEQNNNAALEELCLTSNHLNDNIFDVLLHAGRLKTLRLAHNRIAVLPADCVHNWPDLEVLVLSGNMLQQLPEQLSALSQLRVLRCCNNLLLSTPKLAKLKKLKILDLAHNHLDRINLLSLVPVRILKYLDLSGNLQLQVDEQQLKACQTQSQRIWSLIDVSGNNRAALPTSINTQVLPSESNEKRTSKVSTQSWSLGFAETPGDLRRLLVSQLRASPMNGFDQALFGMFESETEADARIAQQMAQLVPELLKQEQTLNETSHNDYMKYTLLAAQRQCSGNLRSATLFHLVRLPTKVHALKTKRFVLRMANMGYLDAYLVRRTTHLRLTQPEIQLGVNTRKQAVGHSLPDPEILEVTLSNDDQYLVLANDQLWSVMDIGRAAREIRKEENALLAAKRLLEIAQSFGATKNLSLIVVRFCHLSTDVDHLIRELKQSVRKKPAIIASQSQNLSVSKRTCCDRSNACRHRTLDQELLAGRYSPSGQSNPDILAKDIGGSSGHVVAKDEFILAHARVMQEEQQLEMLDETESVLSEEQFKCWEYMLEQNTQLLFDKELNTISKSFSKQRMPTTAKLTAADCNDLKSNLIRNVTNKFISSSTPHLPQSAATIAAYQQPVKQPLTTEHFGSMRSFQQSHNYGYNLIDGKARDAFAKLGGGPHAAYFGSLQRRMPYNFEYDFPVPQERNHDVLDEEDVDEDVYTEHESRMRKYWGVATTEL